jgi:hypothetical protein
MVTFPVEQPMDDIPGQFLPIGEVVPFGIPAGTRWCNEDFSHDRFIRIAETQHISQPIVAYEASVEPAHGRLVDKGDEYLSTLSNPHPAHRTLRENLQPG